MTRGFVYLKKFSDKWGKLGLTDGDLAPLEKFLLENPQAGDVLQGTGGIRKLRWTLPNKGKSGGIRILYVDLVIHEEIYILDLFLKSEKENLTGAERNNMKKAVTELKKGR